jgi:predicted DNA binding CopG/RHH family protein
MAKKARLPKFQSEAEAAKWFDAHKESVADWFEEAAAKGELKRMSERFPDRKPAAKNVLIRLQLSEIDRARRLAARKGLRYQTYIKMLLHEAMNRDEAQAQ